MLIKTTEVKVPKRIYLLQQYGFNIAYTSYKCSSVPNENSVMFFFFLLVGVAISEKRKCGLQPKQMEHIRFCMTELILHRLFSG